MEAEGKGGRLKYQSTAEVVDSYIQTVNPKSLNDDKCVGQDLCGNCVESALSASQELLP